MQAAEKVRVRCPRCGAVALARPADVGRKTYCWSCRQLIEITAARADASNTRVGVTCRLCQTRMSVAARHVGRKVKCPDCGVLTVVKPPDLPDARPAPAAMEGEQYELWEEESPPSGAPQAAPADAPAEPLVRQAAPEVNEFVRARRELPRFPLVLGVLEVARSRGIVSRWLAASVGLALAGLMLTGSFGYTAGLGGGRMAMSFGVVVGVCLMVGAALVACFCLIFLAAVLLEIVVESSEGNARIESWPSANPPDWFGEAIALAVACMAAAAPGYLVGLAFDSRTAPALGAAVSLWLLLPWVVLSQLEVSSAFGLFSPRLLVALLGAPVSWMTLLVESGLMAAAMGACVWAIARYGMLIILPTAPVAVLLLMLYARLLGRLAWVIAER